MTAPLYEKPDILALIPKDRHAVIEASAGTGKTFTLEHLVVDLVLEKNVPIEQILVVTFTEKATAELRLRLRQMLEKLLRLRETPANSAGKVFWTIDEQARARLEKALLALDTASISTIHSFCQRTLTEHAFANGRLFGETQVDAREAFGDAFRDALRSCFAVDPAERVWLEAWLSNGSVAGLESFLFSCAKHEGRLRPQFDEEALREALPALALDDATVERFRGELRAAKVHHSTVKTATERLGDLAAIAAQHDLPAPALLKAIADWDSLVDDGGTFAYLLDRTDKAKAQPTVAIVREAVALLSSRFASPEAVIARRFTPVVTERLARMKREQGLFDFDDMLRVVRDVLCGPDADQLLGILRSRFRYALIDEFQDTDEVQWDIFRRVFFESPDEHVLYLVGDPKQAIYRFRGADVATYLAARDEVQRDGERVLLDRNFRSTADAIGAYNRVFDQQGEPPFFTGDIRYDEPVSCGKTDLRLVDGLGRDVPAAVLLHPVGYGKTLPVDAARQALYRTIAQEIRALLADPERRLRVVAPDEERPVRASDIYVLTRTGKEGLDLGRVLREAGVPHAFYKQDGLFKTDEAAHVRDVLAAVADPRDRSKRLKAWLTPFFRISLDELVGASELDPSHPLLERLHAWHALGQQRDFERLFARIVEQSGLVRRAVLLDDGERELTNYLHLFELLLEEAGRSALTLDELVRRLRAFIDGRELPEGDDGDVQRLEGERDAVQIMTMHKSKGLEAAVVFVAGGLGRLTDRDAVHVFHSDTGERLAWVGRMPEEVGAQCSREAREEEQRLQYVALTRAKARLYLPYFGPVDETARAVLGASDDEQVCSYKLPEDASYASVQRRLAAILEAPDADAQRLFERRPIACGESLDSATSSGLPLGSWTPPPDLLADRDVSAEYDGLRRQHGGLFITSYSRMAAAAHAQSGEEFKLEARTLAPVREDDLPGGAETGLFLHDVLERLPLDSLEGDPPVDEWSTRPDVAPLFTGAALAHGLNDSHLPRAHQIVHTALTLPLTLHEGRALAGLARADRVVREMEFLFPFPEDRLPRVDEPWARFEDLGRGFVKGFVDLIFEHDGLVYFADWKSDRLAAFDAASMQSHVTAHYALQARLYTLALVRLLELHTQADYDRRFGGLLYLFVRGMGPDSGVHYERPSWDDVLAWERQLAKDGAWAA